MTFSLHMLKYSIVYTIHYILYCAILHAVQGNMLSNPSDPIYDLQPTHAKVQYSIYYTLYTILC